jgi:CRP/FNR family cyclic AMP-dependent transcriptional regulator
LRARADAGKEARREMGSPSELSSLLVPAPPEVLRKVDLFESLSDHDIEQLAESLTKRTFSEGDVILNQGERGVDFYVIGEGAVNYSVNGKDVGSGGPGDYFGELALVNNRPRAATVTAATDVTAYGMIRLDFRALVERNADIAAGLQLVMAERQDTTT